MAVSATTLLNRLDKIKDAYGNDASSRKLELLRRLDRRRMRRAGDVLRLHEALCFLHAYPDDRRLRTEVAGMLNRFSQRSDLRRFADDLADSGIRGTAIYYPFFWTTAQWLVSRWPAFLSIDWAEFEQQDDLQRVLYMVLPFSETLALDEADLDAREWLSWLKAPHETDAEFLVRRVERGLADETVQETIYEDLEVPYLLSPGPDTPTRTGAWFKAPVVFQNRPLDRSRPDLKQACLHTPRAVRPVSVGTGRRLIEMARDSMVTRSRDLYAFQYADPRDVRLVEFEDGLQFAAMGMAPRHRLMMDSVYGFLTLKSGVPIGYVLSSSYFNSTEVAYNVFETFRGGESALVYGRILAMMRHLFGADAFTVDPYQMGHENEEGLKSGAWWFYYKLGFRPMDAGVKRLLKRELGRMRRNPGYRSSLSTLNELSSKNMYLFLGRPRKDIRGIIPLENIGLSVSRYVAKRFGADRERAVSVCSDEAARLLGVRSLRGWSAEERLAWERWSPLMLALPGVTRWSDDEKRALARVARAKGGRYESDFVIRFDAHRKLRRALLRLAARKYRPV